jgi:hypothetical protein
MGRSTSTNIVVSKASASQSLPSEEGAINPKLRRSESHIPHPKHHQQLYPMSPLSVILPSSNCDAAGRYYRHQQSLGYSTHSESSSASFDVHQYDVTNNNNNNNKNNNNALEQYNLPLYQQQDDSFSLYAEDDIDENDDAVAEVDDELDGVFFSSSSSSSPLSVSLLSLLPVKTKKRVTFAIDPPSSESSPRTHHDGKILDDVDKATLWYRPSELKKIKKACHVTVRLIREGLLTADTDDHCIHGLEGEVVLASQLRDIHRAMVQDMVLLEQDRQREMGLYDLDGIADMVGSLRSRCRHAKFISGLVQNDTAQRQTAYMN